MHAPSTAELLALLDRLADSVDLVTFDVFDTLLRRRVLPPERTKVPAARRLATLFANARQAVSVLQALEGRRQIEIRLGHEAAEAGLDWEYHIRDAFRAWVRMLGRSAQRASGLAQTQRVRAWPARAERLAELPPGGVRVMEEALPGRGMVDRAASVSSGDRLDDEIVEELLGVEMAAEREVSFPEPDMPAVVAHARALGKRVLFVSEMYLGRDQIASLLEAAGYAGLFEGGYVSGDHKLNKGSGRLYGAMLKEAQVSAERWLHVGDNFASDYIAPRRLGGRACLFLPPAHVARQRRMHRLGKLEAADPRWAGAAVVEMCRPELGGNSAPTPSDVPYQIGYFVLGPLFASYVHQLIERVVAERVELLLFVARDGFILQRLWERLAPVASPPVAGARLPRADYAFLSRQAVYAASVEEIGRREVNLPHTPSAKSLREVLLPLGLEPEALATLARSGGFLSLDEKMRAPFADARFIRFIREPELLRQLHARSVEQRALLAAYLEQLGFFSAARVGLADVGWCGTTQDALTRAFGQRPDWPQLHGWYMGFWGQGEGVRATERSRYEGLLYDGGRDPVGSAVLPHFVHLFELAGRAPHATVIGYRREGAGGAVVPVVRQEGSEARQRELRDAELSARLQAGILDFAAAYCRAIPFLEHPPQRYAAYHLAQVDRLIRWPTSAEARGIGEFSHVLDFGSDAALGRDPRAWLPWQPWLWPKAVRRLQETLWPEAALAARGWPGMVAAFNLYHVLRRRRF